jgi:hypothetical protein
MNTQTEITQARHLLTTAVEQLARDTTRATGIHYAAVDERVGFVPSTWEQLQSVHAHIAEIKATSNQWVGLAVLAGHSDQTIYLTAEANYAFRFWHDMGHIQHGLSFTADDERTLQRSHHLDVMWIELGRPVWDEIATLTQRARLLAFKMYHADTVGQIDYIVANGRFPDNQLAFVLAYIDDKANALATVY